MDAHTKLRAQIRAGRELLGLKQSDIADMLGASLSKVSRAESGETKSGDVLLEIRTALEKSGIRFTASGVEITENRMEVFEGEGWFLRLLGDVATSLKNIPDAELLVECGDDKKSTPAAIACLKDIRRAGIKMRVMVEEGNTYLMGVLSEYRYIPKERFNNYITLIYADKFAICTDNGTKAILFQDSVLAKTRRNIFDLLWGELKKPTRSTARERYE